MSEQQNTDSGGTAEGVEAVRVTAVRVTVDLPDGSSLSSGVVVDPRELRRARYPEIPIGVAIDQASLRMKKTLADMADGRPRGRL